jgi:hypothetical protein
MNLSELTFIELYKMYYQIQIEFLRRTWWIIPVIILLFIIFMYSNIWIQNYKNNTVIKRIKKDSKTKYAAKTGEIIKDSAQKDEIIKQNIIKEHDIS